MGKRTNNSDDKDDDFDFERVVKIISTLSFSVGIVIYSFTLGYFHRLEIPASPSFFEAVRFYLSSSLKNLYNGPIVASAIATIAVSVIYAKFSFEKQKWNFSKMAGLIGCSILLLAVLFFFAKQISLFAPVVLSAICASIFFVFIERREANASDKILGLVGYIFATLLLSWWSFSTLDLSFFERSRLNTYFPNGFGVKPYEPSNLIWSEDGKRYWYSCAYPGGVLYGTNDEEHIFVRTQMSGSLHDHLCIPIELPVASSQL